MKKHSKKQSMKHFTVLYKKQSPFEQKHPDMKGLDHNLYTMPINAVSRESAEKQLSMIARVKVVRITENSTQSPVFKSQTFSL